MINDRFLTVIKKINHLRSGWIRAVMFLAFVLNTCLVSAQSGAVESVEMADGMRSNGKIYVVIAVILTILAGLILYVASVDRKVTRLEKEKR